MTCCPWCRKHALKAKKVRIGDVEVIASPHKCSACGAEEINIYSVADGREPNDAERERGFYKGKRR